MGGSDQSGAGDGFEYHDHESDVRADGDYEKKRSLHAAQRDTQRVEQAREAYTIELGSISAEQFVFVDESGCYLNMTRTYGWSNRGERAQGVIPFLYGEHVSMIGSVALSGKTSLMNIEGTVNGEVFLAYVRSCLRPTLEEGQIVNMDNNSIHKVKGIEEEIKNAGCRLRFLPPYSPDFNPIEFMWSKLKEYLRSKAARTLRTLNSAIAEGLKRVTTQDISGWLAGCGCSYQLI